MGRLIAGKWSDEWYDTESSGGQYVRKESSFRDWIRADGSTPYLPEAGRYHLYVSLACPWAHRALIFRKLKGLEEAISVSVVDPGETALTVVVLIRVVGVILAIALLTIPAAIARHWAHRLDRMMVLASVIGAVCITAGLFLSYGLSIGVGFDIPTGPFIILLAAAMYGVSALLRFAARLRNRI